MKIEIKKIEYLACKNWHYRTIRQDNELTIIDKSYNQIYKLELKKYAKRLDISTLQLLKLAFKFSFFFAYDLYENRLIKVKKVTYSYK